MEAIELNASKVLEVLSGRLIAIAVVLAVSYGLYATGLAIYYLYFSELAGFPGPKIAAASEWYEFYHDCIRNGKYIFEIEKMHKKYGSWPLIRSPRKHTLTFRQVQSFESTRMSFLSMIQLSTVNSM